VDNKENQLNFILDHVGLSILDASKFYNLQKVKMTFSPSLYRGIKHTGLEGVLNI
jgi:hypothetical protein